MRSALMRASDQAAAICAAEGGQPSSVSAEGAATFPEGEGFWRRCGPPEEKAFGGGATAAEGKTGDDDTKQLSMMELLGGE